MSSKLMIRLEDSHLTRESKDIIKSYMDAYFVDTCRSEAIINKHGLLIMSSEGIEIDNHGLMSTSDEGIMVNNHCATVKIFKATDIKNEYFHILSMPFEFMKNLELQEGESVYGTFAE